MLDASPKLYNNLLKIYLHSYNKTSTNKRESLCNEYKFDSLAMGHYSPWFEELELFYQHNKFTKTLYTT